MNLMDLSREERARRALLVGALLWVGLARADDAPRQVKPLILKDTKGQTIRVPHATRATLLLFLRIDQDQSLQTVENVKKALEGAPPAQVLVILSGKLPPEDVKTFVAKTPWPVVTDPEYELVGQFVVRVWPLTVFVLPDGHELARMPGLPLTFVQDLSSYFAFAAGKIDRETLKKRLATTHMVGDTPRQMADRHLRVAERLMAKDLVAAADGEVNRGLKLQPGNERLLLARARILLLTGKPAGAMNVLSRLDATSALAGKIGVLKGWALVNMGRCDEAIPVLAEAVKLYPDPSEGRYFLGVAYQRKGQADQAAAAFRAAFEATPTGRRVASGGDGAGTLPEQRPTDANAATRPEAGPK